MAKIVIRVGVALDSTVSQALRPIEEGAKRARKVVDTEMRALAKTTGSVYRDNAKEAEKSNKAVESSTVAMLRLVNQHYATSGREMAASMQKAARDSERAWSSFRKGIAGDAGWRTVGTAGRGNLRRFAGAALGTAGSIARGAGVDFSVQGLVGAAVQNQAEAAKIAGHGFVEGEAGPAGILQDPKAILADAKAAANGAAISTKDALTGLDEFTKKSSDLAVGRQLLGDMAKFAKATGSELNDVAVSAGDMSKKLEGTPDKAERLRDAMMILAAQGKRGALDFSDMAKVIPTVVAPARKFAEGTSAAITELGVALQITKSFSKNAAVSATGVSSFVQDLTSKSGAKGLSKFGINPYADKGHTQLRSVESIITEALVKTGGDLGKLSSVFSNKRSGSVLQAFGEIYTNAEKNKKGSGAAAIRSTFQQFGAAATPEGLQRQLQQELDTTASKAQRFQNNLEEVAESMASKVLPAMEQLGPTILEVAKDLAGLASWAASNPWKALGAGLAAALAKSVAEAGLKAAITGALQGSPIAIGALAVTAGTVAIVKAVHDVDTARKEAETSLDEAEQKRLAVSQASRKGGAASEDVEALKKARDELAARVEAAEARHGQGAGFFETAKAIGTGETGTLAKTLADMKNLPNIKEELARLNATLSGTLKVSGNVNANVTNPTPTGADSSGRTPPSALPVPAR